MKKITTNLLVVLFIFSFFEVSATSRVYFLHGFGGPGFEMAHIMTSVKKNGYNCELYTYPSLERDVDSVGLDLLSKLTIDENDTVSFVTHSMGALVVRSIYEHIDSSQHLPFIYRIVMIAPPNNGSPVADFFSQFTFLSLIFGPNINNLTTNPVTGAGKYPKPTCEVGLIAGSYGNKKGVNIFVHDDNDGLLIPEQTRMGIEKDVVFIKSWHVGLLFHKQVTKQVLSFLQTGEFEK